MALAALEEARRSLESSDNWKRGKVGYAFVNTQVQQLLAACNGCTIDFAWDELKGHS